jgi:hypothetical protein
MGGANPRDGLPPASARKKTLAGQMYAWTHAARRQDTHENGEPTRDQRGTLKVCVYSTQTNNKFMEAPLFCFFCIFCSVETQKKSAYTSTLNLNPTPHRHRRNPHTYHKLYTFSNFSRIMHELRTGHHDNINLAYVMHFRASSGLRANVYRYIMHGRMNVRTTYVRACACIRHTQKPTNPPTSSLSLENARPIAPTM